MCCIGVEVRLVILWVPKATPSPVSFLDVSFCLPLLEVEWGVMESSGDQKASHLYFHCNLGIPGAWGKELVAWLRRKLEVGCYLRRLEINDASESLIGQMECSECSLSDFQRILEGEFQPSCNLPDVLQPYRICHYPRTHVVVGSVVDGLSQLAQRFIQSLL